MIKKAWFTRDAVHDAFYGIMVILGYAIMVGVIACWPLLLAPH